ncbi:hypothetical protein pipiens_005888 [Culex pipiens pipiens]|uniref:Fibronectin type-III domain-containing protein n=1 Tax=Culex pipiens pipiens TaxID=38569 RepID=A0ABD1DSX4_CULPP
MLPCENGNLSGSIPSAPENITVTFLTPTSVRVSWQTSMDPHTMPVDKYDVTYKPTDARVVVVVAGNREAVTLGGLSPDTQYQLTVAAVWNGKKYRSRPIVFRTLEPPRTSFQQDSGALAGNSGPPISPHADTAPSLSGFGIFSDEFGNISTNSTSRNELPTTTSRNSSKFLGRASVPTVPATGSTHTRKIKLDWKLSPKCTFK